MKLFTLTLGCLSFLVISQAAAAAADCNTPAKKSMELLYSYIKKNGNAPEVYSIGALGNSRYMLDQQYNIESPQEAADTITQDPVYKTAKVVVLIWPYSGWSGAPYAHRLQDILHKPVKGFDGPLWWYPDGAAIASHAEKSTMAGPTEANVAQCITADGRYHEEDECRPLLKTHDAGTAIFANQPFVLTCDDVKGLQFLADKGDAASNMRLFFFDSFVNVDDKKAALEVSKAAFGGDPLASYIVAGIMRDKMPPETALYLQFLKRAADGGNEKAKAELGRVSKQQP